MKRLEAACLLIDECESFADIGCDHGLVSRYVAENSLAKKIFACDISAPSLNKARLLLGDCDNAEFFVSDGFDALPYAPSQAAILGMGGPEIIKILSSDKRAATLVLQPQNRVFDLRKFLYSTGYVIKSDFCVSERGRYYDIIKAESGKGEMPCKEKLCWGVFCDRKNPVLRERLIKEEKKVAGYMQTETNADKLRVIKEVLKWQL